MLVNVIRQPPRLTTYQLKENTLKKSNDLMNVTLFLSYLLLAWVVVIILSLAVLLEEETDQVYYGQTEEVSKGPATINSARLLMLPYQYHLIQDIVTNVLI